MYSLDIDRTADHTAGKPHGGQAKMNGQARSPYARTKSSTAAEGAHPEVEPRETGQALLQPVDASTYILSMVAELRALAKSSGFRFLTYLLEMAFQEAFRLTSEMEETANRRAGPAKPGRSV